MLTNSMSIEFWNIKNKTKIIVCIKILPKIIPSQTFKHLPMLYNINRYNTNNLKSKNQLIIYYVCKYTIVL